MRKGTVLSAAAVFFFWMAGIAGAMPFTLDSYTISLNQSDPGLAMYADKILSEPYTFNLDVGQSENFTLFKLGTTETWSNSDDKVAKPISVAFDFSSPTATSSVSGTTVGKSFLFLSWGQVDWNSPALFNFGDAGQFSILLNDGAFWTPGSHDITGSIKYVSAASDPAPTPEPGTVLLLGIGLAGFAALKWRSRA